MYQMRIKLFVFIIISVNSECIGTKSDENGFSCDEKVVNIKIELLERNIYKSEIKDLNKVIKNLFENMEKEIDKIDSVYKSNNKIFLRSFNFNINFDSGDTKIDLFLKEQTCTRNNTVTTKPNPMNSTASKNTTNINKKDNQNKIVNSVNGTKTTSLPIIKNTTQIIKNNGNKTINNANMPKNNTTQSMNKTPNIKSDKNKTVNAKNSTKTTVISTTRKTPSMTNKNDKNKTTSSVNVTKSSNPPPKTKNTNNNGKTKGTESTTKPTTTKVINSTIKSDKIPLTTVKPDKINIKVEKDQIVVEKYDKIKGNEILKVIDFDTAYYYDDEENSTDYLVPDYIDLYKDTTNENIVYIPTESSVTEANAVMMQKNDIFNDYSDPICSGEPKCQNFTKSVYPWIASIFIKTVEDGPFNYYCDGVLLSDRVILTDARCLQISNSTVQLENILMFLGKSSLQSFGGDEKMIKANQIILHPNFTNAENVENDLALLVLEDKVEPSQGIQPACVHDVLDSSQVEDAGTTSWAVNGAMLPIFFEKEPDHSCKSKTVDVFCVTYGYDVALCPNYGGMYATKRRDKWCIQGIRFGDPADRGICYTKNVFYTSLDRYWSWINSVIDANKNVL